MVAELTQYHLRFSRGIAGGCRCCGETGSRCRHSDGRWYRCCQRLLTKDRGLVKFYSSAIHGIEGQVLTCDVTVEVT